MNKSLHCNLFVGGKPRPLARAIRSLLMAGSAAIALPPQAMANIPCPIKQGYIDLLSTESVGDCTIEQPGNLFIFPEGSLATTGALANYGLIDSAGTIVNTGTFKNYGELYSTAFENRVGGTLDNQGRIGNSGVLRNAGTLTNNAELTSYYGHEIVNESGGVLTNNGTLNLEVTSALNNSGKLINSQQMQGHGTVNNLADGHLQNNLYWSSGNVSNAGTLVNQAGATWTNEGISTSTGVLINDGNLINVGNLSVSGSFNGSGMFDNVGSLDVLQGGKVQLAQIANFSNGTLSGGVWRVDAGAGKATLSFGNAEDHVTTLESNALVALTGAEASFDQVENYLTTNHGILRIGPDKVFTRSQNFVNDGLVDIKAGGTFNNNGVFDGSSCGLSVCGLDIGGRFVNSAQATFNTTQLRGTGTLENHGKANVVGSSLGTVVNHSDGNMTVTLSYNTGTVLNRGGTMKTGIFGGTVVNESGGRMNGSIYSDEFRPTTVINEAGATMTGMYVGVNFGSLQNKGTINGIHLDAGEATVKNERGSIFSGSINLGRSQLINDGEMYLSWGNLVQGATIANSGLLETSMNFSAGGAFVNSGTWRVLSSSILRATEVATDFLQTAGTLTVDGSIQASSITLTGGVLNGTGTLTGPVTVDGATVNPGHSPGTLTIDGDFSLNSGSLVMEFAGTGAGQFDVLRVNGDAHLGGTLDLFALNGFKPVPGDSLDILFYKAVVGGFDSVHLFGFDPGVTANLTFADDRLSLRFSVAAVPVPASIWLFGSALAGLSIGVRRRAGGQKLGG